MYDAKQAAREGDDRCSRQITSSLSPSAFVWLREAFSPVALGTSFVTAVRPFGTSRLVRLLEFKLVQTLCDFLISEFIKRGAVVVSDGLIWFTIHAV